MQIAAQVFRAVIEIVIPQGDIIAAPVVQRLRHGRIDAADMAVIGQGRTLDGVAAVDDQRVFILGKAHGKQPHWMGLQVSEMGRIQVSVGIGGIINRQLRVHVHPRASLERILVEKISIKIISTTMPHRYAPTMLHRLEFMHWISAAPMPPAPTMPSVVASFTLMSKR